uniref:Uncharacterized protein n=1 Tax=Moniliophthora roreri TaxID=221103 RepID=A0A0W0GCT2_MONRR
MQSDHTLELILHCIILSLKELAESN